MTINNLFKTFFSNDKIDTIDEASKLIQGLLESMGTSHEEAKLETENKDMLGWVINFGNSILYIYVYKSDNGVIYLKVISPLTLLPEKNILPFYRTLLETNMYLNGYIIGVEKNMAILMSIIKIQNIDSEEARKMVEQIAKLTLDISDKLIEEFSAVRFESQ